MRTISWGRYFATAIATVAAVLAFGSTAGAVSVNGFAYQALGPYSEVGEFYDKGLGLPYARAIVAYDSADSPAVMADIHQWVQRMQSRGRQVLISFNHNGAERPSDPGLYRQRIQAFRNWMIDNGSPIPEFTAWNEPNHHLNDGGITRNPSATRDAPLAAQYWKALNSLCQIAVNGQRCTAVAGDFHDPNPTRSGEITVFNSYVAAYAAELASGSDRATPAKWAIHPYSAVANKDFSVVTSWIVANTGSADVWLTELGVKFCREGVGFESLAGAPGDAGTAAAYQDDRASYLKSALAVLPARANRAYYYTLSAPGAATHRHCDVNPGWDTQLLGDQYGYGSAERPAFRTLFPDAPSPALPGVTTGSASAVRQTEATLNGSVDPNGLDTTYQFEYGFTSAYGSTAPATPATAGAGNQPLDVQQALTGLLPDTTYHYRLVARSTLGTSPGPDRTFTTQTKSSVLFVKIQGVTQTVARGPGNRLLQYATDDGRDWHFFQIAGPGTTFSNPQMTMIGGSPQIAVRGPNDELVQYYVDNGRWTSFTITEPGVVFSDPVFQVVNGQQMVVVQGPDHTLLQFVATPGVGWSRNVIANAGTTYSSPLIQAIDNQAMIVVRGPENSLRRFVPASWGGWEAETIAGTGTTFSSPRAVFANGLLQIAVRGPENALVQHYLASGRWSSFAIGEPGTTFSDPVFQVVNGQQMVVVESANNSLVQFVATPGAGWSRAILAPAGTVFSSPFIQVIDDEAMIGVRGPGGDLVRYTPGPLGIWQPQTLIPGAFE